MKTRIITALTVFPLFFALIYIGGHYLAATLLVVSLIGLFEFYNALKGRIKPIKSVGAFGAIILYSVLLTNNPGKNMHFMIFIILMMLLFAVMVFKYPKYNIMDISCTLLGIVYIPVLMSVIYAIRTLDNGEYLVWFIFLSAWGSDTFAYFVGKFFGKNKMAPKISPKKTIEGLFGGIIGAILISVAYVYLVEGVFQVSIPYMRLIAVLVGIFGAIFGVIGDLSASAIKRNFKIKDYGKILPGHGGILDRFDSILFTAPVVYIIILLVETGAKL